jgi:chromosome segregation ATPase
MGFICKTKDNAMVEPRELAEPRTSSESSNSSPVSAELHNILLELVVELRREQRAEIQKAVGALRAERASEKNELKLLQHQFIVLREDFALAKSLRDLRDEVAEARAQVPKLPAIVADLEAEQARLERELAKTKDRLGKMRVDQSIANYNLAQLQKQAQASSEASIEMEFESRSSHFQMRAAHPDAARALKEFATGIINGQTDGTLWLPGPVGNA